MDFYRLHALPWAGIRPWTPAPRPWQKRHRLM
jgi:hypothetical protein